MNGIHNDQNSARRKRISANWWICPRGRGQWCVGVTLLSLLQNETSLSIRYLWKKNFPLDIVTHLCKGEVAGQRRKKRNSFKHWFFFERPGHCIRLIFSRYTIQNSLCCILTWSLFSASHLRQLKWWMWLSCMVRLDRHFKLMRVVSLFLEILLTLYKRAATLLACTDWWSN